LLRVPRPQICGPHVHKFGRDPKLFVEDKNFTSRTLLYHWYRYQVLPYLVCFLLPDTVCTVVAF
jgi:hypothetical protein